MFVSQPLLSKLFPPLPHPKTPWKYPNISNKFVCPQIPPKQVNIEPPNFHKIFRLYLWVTSLYQISPQLPLPLFHPQNPVKIPQIYQINLYVHEFLQIFIRYSGYTCGWPLYIETHPPPQKKTKTFPPSPFQETPRKSRVPFASIYIYIYIYIYNCKSTVCVCLCVCMSANSS